jgi:adenosylmethionine-8-amino-7-oxononanoate aminotransferase
MASPLLKPTTVASATGSASDTRAVLPCAGWPLMVMPARAAALGDHLLERLRAILGDHPHVGEIRGLGLMCAVEFVQDRETKAPFPASEKVGTRINAEAQQRGLFSRNRGDIYMLAPPFVITTEQIDRIVAILTESVHTVLGT